MILDDEYTGDEHPRYVILPEEGLRINDEDLAKGIVSRMTFDHASAYQIYTRKNNESVSAFPSEINNSAYGDKNDEILVVAVFRQSRWADNNGDFEGVYDELSRHHILEEEAKLNAKIQAIAEEQAAMDAKKDLLQKELDALNDQIETVRSMNK